MANNNFIAQGAQMPLGPLSGFLAGRNDAIGLEELSRGRTKEDFDLKKLQWDLDVARKNEEALGDLTRKSKAMGLQDDITLGPDRLAANQAIQRNIPALEKAKALAAKLVEKEAALNLIEELHNSGPMAYADPQSREEIKSQFSMFGIPTPEIGTPEFQAWLMAGAKRAANTKPRLEEVRKQLNVLEKVREEKALEKDIHETDNESRERIAAANRAAKAKERRGKPDDVFYRLLDKESRGEPLTQGEQNVLAIYQNKSIPSIPKANAQAAQGRAMGLNLQDVQTPVPTNRPASVDTVPPTLKGKIMVIGGEATKQGGQPIGVGDRALFEEMKRTLPEGTKIITTEGIYVVKRGN